MATVEPITAASIARLLQRLPRAVQRFVDALVTDARDRAQVRRALEVLLIAREIGEKAPEVPEPPPAPEPSRQALAGARRGVKPRYVDEMLDVPSSNVYRIAYNFDTETLFVQFLGTYISGGTWWGAGKKFRAGPGPLYSYSNVSKDEWEDFKMARSKGVWVWDHLRIRGTRYGHQKPYRKISGAGLVPLGAALGPRGPVPVRIASFVPLATSL